MGVLEGASLIAGVGALVGTFVKRKSLSGTEQLVAYGTGAALIGFSAYENLKHHERKKKWEDRRHEHEWQRHHHHHRRHDIDHRGPYPAEHVKGGYTIEGGEELPYDYLMRQDQMVIAQDAGTTMWPEREPPGYLTGMGIEQRLMPGSKVYPYPDSIYQSARSRVAVSP
jgi:hypothetical protein